MADERVYEFAFQGHGYRCRVVANPAPVTEPIVLVGGAFQTMYAFRRLEAPWAAAATVVSVDLPGSAAVGPLPARYGFDFLARVLGDLVDRLGLGPVNLFGASYGAHVAYWLAHDRPELVARLALAGVAPSFPDTSVRDLRRMGDRLRAVDAAGFARMSVEGLMSPPDRPIRRRAAVARLLERVLAALEPSDVPAHLESIGRLVDADLPAAGVTGVPALCFTGEHDTLTEPDLGRRVAASIDGALFTLIREADHLINLERGDDFARLLTHWFTDQPLAPLDFLTPLEHPRRHAELATAGAAPR